MLLKLQFACKSRLWNVANSTSSCTKTHYFGLHNPLAEAFTNVSSPYNPSIAAADMVVGWVYPWVGLGEKFSWLKWVGLGSVISLYIFFAIIIIKLTLHCSPLTVLIYSVSCSGMDLGHCIKLCCWWWWWWWWYNYDEIGYLHIFAFSDIFGCVLLQLCIMLMFAVGSGRVRSGVPISVVGWVGSVNWWVGFGWVIENGPTTMSELQPASIPPMRS